MKKVISEIVEEVNQEAYARLEHQLYNNDSYYYDTNNLTHEEIEVLKRILTSDYRIYHDTINHRTYLESASDKQLMRYIGNNKLQNYYYMDSPFGIPETELKPEIQHARWQAGIPLERVFQRALTMAQINFYGNPLDPKKYPHASKGVHCDIETSTELIELTNPLKSTYMNDEIMNEKLSYFEHDDPEHKKHWIIATSHKNWGKAIDKQIQQNKITVLVIGQRVHHQNSDRILYELSAILRDIHQEGITNNLLNTIYKINNKKTNKKLQDKQLTLKTLYQLIVVSSYTLDNGYVVDFSSTNNSALEGKNG